MKSWILGADFLRQSPSRADDISEEGEKRYRRETVINMEKAGESLKFPRAAKATAQVFFHRFYALHSFKKFQRFDIAVTCLFLAGKVEEHPRKLETIIQCCHQIWNRLAQPTLKLDSEDYEKLRETMLRTERQLLHTMAFDLCVKHPYKDLFEIVKNLCQKGLILDTQKRDFAKSALDFVNDSMRTSLCLQFEPQKVATAAIYMTTVYMRVKSSEETAYMMKQLEISSEELSRICQQIMEVYGLANKHEQTVQSNHKKNNLLKIQKISDLQKALILNGVILGSQTSSLRKSQLGGSNARHPVRSKNGRRPGEEVEGDGARASKKPRREHSGI